MSRLPLILLALLLLWPAAASAESPTEYRAVLAETLRAAEAALLALPADASLADYPPLRLALQRLEAIDHIATDSGAAVAVDNHSLVQRFQGSRAVGRRAFDSLRQLLEALDASAEVVDWTKDGDFRGALNEVLSRPEFQPTADSARGRFLDDLRARLFRWLDSLFPGFTMPKLPGAELDGPVAVVFWLVAGALAIFAVVFLAFVWRDSRHSMARFAALRKASALEVEDARAARLGAERAANTGDYRLAIHYLYLWAVLHLAEQSGQRFDRSLTNREQVRLFAEGGEVGELMRAAVDAFDQIWYGHAACTADEYGRFRSTVERIVGVAT